MPERSPPSARATWFIACSQDTVSTSNEVRGHGKFAVATKVRRASVVEKLMSSSSVEQC